MIIFMFFYILFILIMKPILEMSEEEKKKIREKHDALEKEARQRKDDLKKGVAFKPKEK